MKKGIVILLATILTGCSRGSEQTGTADIAVLPGRGIPDACELGMSVSEVRRKNPSSIHGTYEECGVRTVLLPTLGATISITNEDQTVDGMYFHVTPFDNPAPMRMKLERPFQGRLGTALSFRGQSVTANDVIEAFGIPSVVWTNPPAPSSGIIDRAVSGGSLYMKHPTMDLLVYYHEGVSFNIVSNTVIEFGIMQPR